MYVRIKHVGECSCLRGHVFMAPLGHTPLQWERALMDGLTPELVGAAEGMSEFALGRPEAVEEEAMGPHAWQKGRVVSREGPFTSPAGGS